MRTHRRLTALLFTALLAAGPAAAGEGAQIRLDSSCCDPPTRWAPRHEPDERRFAITTQSGKATLLLTDSVLALQLSDRTMHRIDRELRQKQRDHRDEPLADLLEGAVIGGVRRLLDHSAECPIADIANVRYIDGRLRIEARDGSDLFDKLEMNDERVMRSFSERDALAFEREFRAAKARMR